MNDRKWKQLLGAARREPPPPPPEGFDLLVLQTVRREDAPARREAIALFDQLSLLFPRLAWAAAALIVLCAAGDLISAALNPSLPDSVAQISEQWFFPGNGF